MIAVLLTVAGLGAGAAESPPTPPAVEVAMQAGKMAYYEGRAEQALAIFNQVLQRGELTSPQQEEALKFMAYSAFLGGNRGLARSTWKKLLTLNPDVQADPNEVSPEFVKFFE